MQMARSHSLFNCWLQCSGTPCGCQVPTHQMMIDRLLCEHNTAVDCCELLTDKTPLQNELVIGAISLQLVVSCLHSIEHGSITLAYNDAFWASSDNRAANLKLTGILLNIKVCHWRVLKDCINAEIYY